MKLYEEPSNEEDEFENPEQRQKAYRKASKLAAEDMLRMRDKHGDIR